MDDSGYTPSAKYSSVYPACVERIAAEESHKHKNTRDRERAVRNRLYQITGAYAAQGSAARSFERSLDGRLSALSSFMDESSFGSLTDESALLSWCADSLAAHTSTRERLSVLVEFYGFLKDTCADAKTIADYGCGLNPFALPLWKPSGLVRYDAYDVDMRSVEYANALFRRLGLPESAAACDLVAETPAGSTDAALLLKLLPVLDMQRAGRGIELLRQVSSHIKVVSYPLSGLSGTQRARRIDGTAARFEREAAAAGIAIAHSRRIGSEMVYVVSSN
ncbi:16S rRNA methyltransferase [Clostridia bacterium]|nr:16S rRNA methyltransferase [Clostridia bacterium]